MQILFEVPKEMVVVVVVIWVVVGSWGEIALPFYVHHESNSPARESELCAARPQGRTPSHLDSLPRKMLAIYC